VRFVVKNASACPRPRVGLLDQKNKKVIDLSSALQSKFGSLTTMRDFLNLGDSGIEAAKQVATSNHNFRFAEDDVRLLAPVVYSDKVICVGMNYVDHCAEQNVPIPTEPIIFSKFASTIIASGDPIYHSKEMKELDYEVELAVVIGKAGRHIPKEKAFEHVAGLSVAHDVSERFWQLKKNGGQWLLGKTFDNFCPLGPSIVSLDEIGDPNNLSLKCIVNGNVMQNSNTKQMVFKVDDLISWVSQFCTLLPGDVILTGTPPGVGCFKKPVPFFLKPGDIVTCEIEKIGSITNQIVPLPSKTNHSKL